MPDVVPAFFIFSNVSEDEKYTGNRNRWKKVFHYRNYKPKLRTFNEGTETEYTVDLNKLAKVYDMYEFPGENKGFFQSIPEAEFYELHVPFNNTESRTIYFPPTRFSGIPIVTLELLSSNIGTDVMLTNVTQTEVTIKATTNFTGVVVVRAIYSESYPARVGWDLVSAVQRDASFLESIGVLFDAEFEEYPSINITGINEYYATALNPTEDAIIQHDILEPPVISSPYSGSAYIDFYARADGQYYSNSMYYLKWSLTDAAIEYMAANAPIAANMVLFLDPESPDTIITSGTIEQLGDRSSNAAHFSQSVVSSRPVVIKRKEYGNRQIISFNREKQFLQSISDFVPTDSGEFTIYVYCRTPGPTGNAGTIFGSAATEGASGNAAAYAMFRIDTRVASRLNMDITNYQEQRNNNDSTGIVTLTSTIDAASTGSLWAKKNYENAVDASDSTLNSGTPYTRKLLPQPYYVGSRNINASEPLEGEIACVLIYSAIHSDEEVKTMTDWLEWKYAAEAEPDFELDTPAISGHLQIMLDPSGSNTTVVNGAVSQLGDESGSSLHATQATDYRRPPYLEFDPDFGGQPSMFGDGATTGLATPSFQAGLQADGDDNFFTVYGVIKQGTLNGTRIFGHDVGSGTGRFFIEQATGNLMFRTSNPGGSYTTKYVPISNGDIVRFGVQFDLTTGVDTVPLIMINGSVSGVGYAETSASDDTSFDNINIGVLANQNSNGRWWDGKSAFFAGYKSRHSEEMMRAMDEWMEWKYAPLSAAISASLEEARYDEITPPITANMSLNLNPNGGNTVTAISGAFTVCSQLGDESGFGRHAVQAVTSIQPIVNLADSEFNDKNSLSFDGIDDSLVIPSFQPGNGRTYYTIYGVIKTGSSAGELVIFGPGTGGTGRLQIRQRNSGTQIRFYFTNPGFTYKDFTSTPNTVYRIAVVYDVTLGADAIPEIYINGSDSGIGYSATGASDDTDFDNRAVGVGSTDLGTNTFDGKIGCIIAYDQFHTKEMVNTMDKWLKWNFIP